VREPRRARHGRSHAPPKKGLPASLLVALASLGIVLFAILAYQFFAGSGKRATLKRARTYAELREFDDALAVLATIPKDGSKVARDAQSIEEQIRAELARIERARKEQEGEVWWGRYLENLETRGLQKVTPPAARVFVERSDEFLNLYPGHSRTEWVKERRALYASKVDLSRPLGWEDIDYRATLARTRYDFADAFLIVDGFLSREAISPEDAAKARDLRSRLETGARAHFERKWEEVEQEVERGRLGEARGILLGLLPTIGVEELREKARREEERLAAVSRSKG
jgi:hypothetical protein